jgi:hypothetical protein
LKPEKKWREGGTVLLAQHVCFQKRRDTSEVVAAECIVASEAMP